MCYALSARVPSPVYAWTTSDYCPGGTWSGRGPTGDAMKEGGHGEALRPIIRSGGGWGIHGVVFNAPLFEHDTLV